MNALITASEAQMARQAQTDAEVLELWVHGRSPHTQRAYTHDVAAFMAFFTRRVSPMEPIWPTTEMKLPRDG